jgi:hypothetical protein
MQAAKQRSGEMKVSLSATVAEAAKESLLSSYLSEREQEILKAVDRNFHALRRLERQLRLEIAVLKEMIGVGMRSFFNHTTPIPEATKNAALRSGKERFHRYLDLLATNLRSGESILKDLPLPEAGEPAAAAAPDAGGQVAKGTASQQPKVEAAANEHRTTAARGVPVHAGAQSLPRSNASERRDRGLFERNSDGD